MGPFLGEEGIAGALIYCSVHVNKSKLSNYCACANDVVLTFRPTDHPINFRIFTKQKIIHSV